MQCLFEALQPVHVEGHTIQGRFSAEVTEAIESLVANGLIEPVFAPVEPVETPCWEVDHLEA